MTDVLGAVKKLDQEPWKMFTKKLPGKSSLVISEKPSDNENLKICYMKISTTCRNLPKQITHKREQLSILKKWICHPWKEV